MDELTHSNEQSRQKQNPFFKYTLVARCLHMINRHGKHTAGVFGPFLSCALASNVVTAQVSGSVFKLPLKTRYKQKRISQVVATAAQSTATEHRCAEVPVSGSVQRTPEHVTVWEDKTCLCASRSRSLYFFQKHQRPHGRVADKKEVKLLKN